MRGPARFRSDLLSAAEVAELFAVSPRTVTRWARSGALHTIRTPGRAYRFFADEILPLLDDGATPTEVDAVVVPFGRRFVTGGSSRSTR